MSRLALTVADITLGAAIHEAMAPRTCEALKTLLPLRTKCIHVRWSGEAVWLPLGERELGLGFENPTSYPAVGQLLLYPGGVSEVEILLAYGYCHFASKAGTLAGNHFATIDQGTEHLAEIGRLALWQGAQEAVLELV